MAYRRRLALLSRGEAAFFGPLKAAVGSKYLVMCKVRLADVVSCRFSTDDPGPFSAISQKHLDFVLCDPRTTRIVLAVELDDRSHEADDRRRRDRFVDYVLRMAGVRIMRVRARARYRVDEIRRRLDAILG
ncbi:MAG: DUF2726 domain-containing protein [Phycisphaerales bacterium]|nr:DUF2726 domain-containing protein [Phycisphaerales bacterium]